MRASLGVLTLATGLGLALAAPSTTSQAQPLGKGQTITIVVPLAPGGGVDATGRLVAEKLQERLKQSVVVENRTGAGGIVGTEFAARAAPDGHTLLLMSSSATIFQWVNKGVPFDVARDFVPVARVAASPLVLYAHPSVNAGDVKELIELAKTKDLSVAVPGFGSTHHLAHLMLNIGTKVSITDVPYRGTGPGLADFLPGRVPLIWASPIALNTHVEQGKAKPLGVASAKRAAALPDVPTIAESAVPGFDFELWFGVAAPAKTPPEIVARYTKEIEAILALPDVRQRLDKLGFEPAFANSEQFRKIIAQDLARYGKVAKAAGIVPK